MVAAIAIEGSGKFVLFGDFSDLRISESHLNTKCMSSPRCSPGGLLHLIKAEPYLFYSDTPQSDGLINATKVKLTITAASTALFSTWVFVENFGLLFDAGDGASAGLGQKCRKIRHIFVTHADRDHICGLLQLNQLNARHGIPSIYYPKDCGSFPALRDFVGKFDPQSGSASWIGLEAGNFVDLNKEYLVEARTSEHVSSGELTKALDYTVCSRRRSLRDGLKDLSGPEIAKLRKSKGDSHIMESRIEKLIGYSGDAPKLDRERWQGVKILIHEATFLDPKTARNSHSNLPQVIHAASELELEALILLHFSARYSKEEIENAIRREAEAASPSFPIFAVYPGEIVKDVLSSTPVWETDGKERGRVGPDSY